MQFAISTNIGWESTNMTREEIIRFWGAANLRRWSRHDLRDVAIPESSKSFLVEVGLPYREQGWTMNFDDGARLLPRLATTPSYRRIGFDYVLPICLDERRNGCVVLVEDEIGRRERFINSNVQLFGECLVYYQRYRLIEQEDRRDLIQETEHQMRRADTAAFRNVESWWPVIVEQMGDGLL
jgi:hypothetical protein